MLRKKTKFVVALIPTVLAGTLGVAFFFHGKNFHETRATESDAARERRLSAAGAATTIPVADDEPDDKQTATAATGTPSFALDADGRVFAEAELPPQTTPEARAESGFYFWNGDLYDQYGGGREYLSDKAADNSRDDRIWIDARIPLEISSRIKLYGVSTLTLGNVSTETSADYAKNYGFGGGFGFSYLLSPSAELNFDFRRTRAFDARSETDDAPTDSAGISIKLKF